MGIDWLRMRPKQSASTSELNRLISLQTEAFQRLLSLWSTGGIEPGEFEEAETHHWQQQYAESSEALSELLEFPAWDDLTQTARDDPFFPISWRVYPITRNSIFPTHWRVQAYRTYLPDQLRAQLREWKDWIATVSAGHFQPYLLELYLHETTLQMKSLYHDIKNVVQESLTKTGVWATKPELTSIREQLLSFQLPPLYRVPLHPPLTADATVILSEHDSYLSITQSVRELISLTRRWDSNVRTNRKLRYYESYYDTTFEQFLRQSQNQSLHELFGELEQCCVRDMGLYLDY